MLEMLDASSVTRENAQSLQKGTRRSSDEAAARAFSTVFIDRNKKGDACRASPSMKWTAIALVGLRRGAERLLVPL
jgi:hypothetical protein